MIMEFFAQHWLAYTAGVTFLIATDLLSLVIPWAVGKAVDAVSRSQGVAEYLLILAAVSLSIALLRFFYRELIMGTTRRLEYFMRARIFSHALSLPSAFYDEAGPGRVMALAVNDVTAVRFAVGIGVMLVVDAAVMGGMAFAMMFRSIDPVLALWAVAPLPVALAAAVLLGRIVHERFRRVQEKFSALTELTQELFGGIKIIQAFGAEKRLAERFGGVNRDNTRANLSLAQVQALHIPLTHVTPLFCYAVALFAGGRLIIDGRITVGGLAAFTGYLGLIIWPVMGLGFLVNILQRGSASLRRLQDFLALAPAEVETAVSEEPREAPDGDLEFRDFSFQYPQGKSPVLKNLSLQIPAGSTVGIVGRTGAGKSTLLRAILRLYPVPAGTIFWGGEDISQMGLQRLRRVVGYVPQDAALFSATIGENIAFGADHQPEDIRQAAALAAVEADIDERAEGLDTRLGEKGLRLSGGQRQRVALARALIRSPRILLLDDVFAALDYRTQADLIGNLRKVEAGRTTLIVSQRVAAVKHAQFIVVLDEGTICEQGTHAELVAAEGLYSKLYRQQLAAEGEI